jgi:hypothetical protein
MSTRHKRSFLRAALVGGAIITASTAASAQQASIAGSWSGGGTMVLKSGNAEKVRCRATFTQSGNGASMTATCANATSRVTQTADLTRVSAGRYIGDFVNAEYGISGSIRITLTCNSLSAALSGGGGSASINLNR